MAKTLITTFILWIAIVAIALAEETLSTDPATKAPTAAAPTATAPTATAPTATKAPTATAPTATAPTATAPTATAPTATAPTTKAPSSTTAASKASKAPTSTKPSTSASSTTTPPTESSSVSPNTAPVPSTTQAPATTLPSNMCDVVSCPEGSTCQPRPKQEVVCLCRTGEMFSETGCVSAKVFPGQVVLEKDYKEEMSNKTSEIYQATADEIENEISRQLKGTNGFGYTVVVELRKKTVSKVRAEGKVEASVQNIYESTAEIKENDVEKAINSTILTFKGIKLCDADPEPCNSSTTTCKSENGTYKCSCKENFFPTSLSNRLCLECPMGWKYDGFKCVECGFGFTGSNCTDKRLFIAVIVSSVLGGLMIIALIALSVVASKSKKKGSKIKEEDIGKPYQSHSFAKPPPSFSNGQSASIKEPTNFSTTYEAPRIPRAISNWESKTNLEMTPSNSRQNLISSGRNSRFNENQDDMLSFSQGRPKNNPYEQIQPNSNPYAQNRATNPYTQNRGQTNPYYS